MGIIQTLTTTPLGLYVRYRTLLQSSSRCAAVPRTRSLLNLGRAAHRLTLTTSHTGTCTSAPRAVAVRLGAHRGHARRLPRLPRHAARAPCPGAFRAARASAAAPTKTARRARTRSEYQICAPAAAARQPGQATEDARAAVRVSWHEAIQRASISLLFIVPRPSGLDDRNKGGALVVKVLTSLCRIANPHVPAITQPLPRNEARAQKGARYYAFCANSFSVKRSHSSYSMKSAFFTASERTTVSRSISA